MGLSLVMPTASATTQLEDSTAHAMMATQEMDSRVYRVSQDIARLPAYLTASHLANLGHRVWLMSVDFNQLANTSNQAFYYLKTIR